MGRRATLNTKKRNRRIVRISIVVAIIAVIVVLALIVSSINNDPYSQYINKPVDPGVLQALTGVSDSTLTSVGLPSSVTPPTAITGTSLTLNGKPEVLYIGGEYCPFCAVERWSIIIALSHFGSFSGLEYMQSSSTDTNPNTPTFTFFAANASAPFNFTSKYVAFVPIEEWDRAENPVRPPSTAQQALYTQYGACPSTGQTGIPFIDIANSYVVNCGAQFNAGVGSPANIAGDNWTQVSSQLNTPNSPVAQVIDGGANSLITAICKVDGEQPSSVCSQKYATVTLADVSAVAAAGQQSLALLPQVREESRWTI